MNRNRIVIAGICCAILVMTGGAILMGPPNAHLPQSDAASGSPGVVPEATAGLVGLSVNSFGPLPACNDEVAINTIVGMFKEHSTQRTLGLANIYEDGGAQSGNVPRRNCGADVQQGGARQPVRYQINQETSGRDSWRITIMPPAKVL